MVNARELRMQLEKIQAEQAKFREEELNPARAIATQLAQRDSAYTNAINGLTQLLSTLPEEPAPEGGRASLSTAIVELLRETGKPMTAQEIWDTLSARGYTTKVSPEYNAVHFGIRDKLVPKGPVERVNPGIWKWVGDKPNLIIQ